MITGGSGRCPAKSPSWPAAAHCLRNEALRDAVVGGSGFTFVGGRNCMVKVPAGPLRLLRARLAALGSSALPERVRPTGRQATTSGARASPNPFYCR